MEEEHKTERIHANTSVFAWLKKWVSFKKLDSGIIKKTLGEYVKFSVCATVLVYFVSTVIVLLRNISLGVPFVPLSIVQAVVITVYFCAPLSIFIAMEHFVCTGWEHIKCDYISKPEKLCDCLLVILIVVGVTFGSGFIFSLLLRNLCGALLIVTCLFVIVPAIIHFFIRGRECHFWITLYALLFSALIVWLIPSSVGGLGPQKVQFYENGSEQCVEYSYYGIADGSIILVNNGTIKLAPIGSGYMQYVWDKWDFIKPPITDDSPSICDKQD